MGMEMGVMVMMMRRRRSERVVSGNWTTGLSLRGFDEWS
jgi:hypothetical protein